MAADELEIHQIGDKQYVTMQDAERYLKTRLDILQRQPAFGKLEVIEIESRQFIEYDGLKAYAEKLRRLRSAWDRFEERRARNK